MPARRRRDARAPVRPDPAVAASSFRRAACDGALEHRADVPQLLLTGGHVENEGAITRIEVARHFVRDPIVTSHEIGTGRLVVLERHQPIRILRFQPGILDIGKLPVPGRIRYFHRKLVCELALAVFREALACHRPRFLFSGTADHADAASYAAGGFGYSTAVAPSCRAASKPASDDPEMSTPGSRSAGSGGVSLRLVTL